ncbi:xylose isomerase [Methanococcoides methylutens]|uniref:Xylose isomerase n=1 Tax=Methanococcoides methylutens TaxID=2226 RepID=A0A099SZP4_METMT|nr:sugar phosphate isomerase/epimerase family protein [Methanococcoides methylutens]KGK98114.1 xylose isomerase [Methanococcoides methylutens]
MIGVSSFAFHELPLSEALEKIEPIADCAEIFSEGAHDLFREEELAYSYDLKYTVHAPSTDMNLSSLREPIRLAAIGLAKGMADICNELDSDVLVVHPGYFSYPVDMVHAQRAFERSIVDLEDISRDTGVMMCIENMPKWDCFLLRNPDLDLGGNGFTLDIGHANTLGNLNDFLEMGDSISHFHLHDNNGAIDEHLFIGGGNIDFPSFSDLLNKNKAIKVIENKCEEDVLKSLEALHLMGIK